MIYEKILGKLDAAQVSGKTVEHVDIEWDDAFKRIHRKVTDAGTEVGIRLDDSILTRGLQEGDILYQGDTRVIAVRIPPCPMIRASLDRTQPFLPAKVCYEIGNRHAPLFCGPDPWTYLTPYNEPMRQMLARIPGVTVEQATVKLDFDRRISSGGHGHSHGEHGHSHGGHGHSHGEHGHLHEHSHSHGEHVYDPEGASS